jgi:MHS family shikimate/dehydroshikimate transporter-like MFS transporter
MGVTALQQQVTRTTPRIAPRQVVWSAISFGHGIMFGPEATFVAELFVARLRYTGASLGFQIGAALIGGLTAMVAAALLAWSDATWPVSLYLLVLACVTLAATLAAPETARQQLA